LHRQPRAGSTQRYVLTPLNARMRWRINYSTEHYMLLFVANQQVGNGNPDLVTMNDDFALGDGPFIGEDQHGIVLAGVQLDDGAAAHAQELVHGDDRAAEHDRNFDFDAIEIGGHVSPVNDQPDPRALMVSERLKSDVEWRIAP